MKLMLIFDKRIYRMKIVEMHAWPPFSLLRSRISMHTCGEHSGQLEPVAILGQFSPVFSNLYDLSDGQSPVPSAQGIA